jgi:thioredoxin 1
MVETISDTNITSVLEKNEIAVIDFWAEWCGPCRILGPIVDEVALNNEEDDNILIGKVNVDEHSGLSTEYGIRGIPTLLFVKNGKVITRMVGVSSAAKIQQTIDSLK